MTRIVLIRPGSTDYDDQARLLGTLEMPMNKRGMEQVEEAVRHLTQGGVHLDAIYSSPCDPAYSTALAIAEAHGVSKVRKLDELRNVDPGLWQGLPETNIRKRYPKVFRQGRDKPQSICPPQGETLSDACRRLAKVINRAIRKHDVFALVAAEPMATVIRCTLQQRGPSVASCLSGEETSTAVQCFESNEFDVASFVDSEQEYDSAPLAVTPVAEETAE